MRSWMSVLGLVVVSAAGLGAAAHDGGRVVALWFLCFAVLFVVQLAGQLVPWPALGAVGLGLALTTLEADPKTGAGVRWVVLWVLGALLVWRSEEISRAVHARRLASGAAPPRSTSFDRAAVAAIGVACLIAILMSAIASFDMSSALSDRSRSRQGDEPGEADPVLAPYTGLSDRLDTGQRGTLTNKVILRIKADMPSLWRGAAFDQYDGRVWTQSFALRTSDFDGDDLYGGARGAAQGAVTRPDFRFMAQEVRVERGPIGVAFGAPVLFEVLPPTGDYAMRADGSFELTTPLGSGARYTAYSDVQLVTEDILRANDPRGVDLPTDLVRLYVRSGGATPKVAALAADIAGDAPTTYDAITRLEAWMSEHTEYTLDIPPLPAGADTVEQFLFVDQRGFCVQIASSLTVMLRSLGVPARLTTGFAPGEASLLGTEFTVRGRDAHAWVEVWFPGIGWQGFDPTADVPLAGEWSTSFWARLGRLIARLALVLLVIGVLLAAVIGGVALARRHRRDRTDTPWVSSFYARLEREGTKRGRARAPTETPSAYIAALGESVLAHPALDRLGEIVEAAAYSGDAPTAAERAEAEQIFAIASQAQSG